MVKPSPAITRFRNMWWIWSNYRRTESTGLGAGKLWGFLLRNAVYRCLQLSNQVAAAAVIVDAKDESAKRFYERLQFVPLSGIPNRLFLPSGQSKIYFGMPKAQGCYFPPCVLPTPPLRRLH
jgi:hypothetical protein